MIRYVAAVAAVLSSATLVVAQDLPRYDPPTYCRTVADAVGGSAQIENVCLTQEQGAYDGLKARWQEIPERVRSYCDQVGRAVGGTYQILSTCIDQELQAGSSTPSFRF
jgi:hypothetical protein